MKEQNSEDEIFQLTSHQNTIRNTGSCAYMTKNIEKIRGTSHLLKENMTSTLSLKKRMIGI